MKETVMWSGTPFTLPNDAIFVSIKQATHLLAMSRSNIYSRIKTDPTFPKLRRVGKLSRFMRDELVVWATSQPLAH